MNSIFGPENNAPDKPAGRGGVDVVCESGQTRCQDKPRGSSVPETDVNSMFAALNIVHHHLEVSGAVEARGKAKAARLRASAALKALVIEAMTELQLRREEYEQGPGAHLPASADRSLDGPNVLASGDATRDSGDPLRPPPLRPEIYAISIRDSLQGRHECGLDGPEIAAETSAQSDAFRDFINRLFVDCGRKQGQPDLFDVAMYAVGAAMVLRVPAASGISERQAAELLGWNRKRVQMGIQRFKSHISARRERVQNSAIILDPKSDRAAA